MRDESLIVQPPAFFAVLVMIPPGIQTVIPHVPGPSDVLEAGLLQSMAEGKPWVYAIAAERRTIVISFCPGATIEIMPQATFEKAQREARAAQAQAQGMMMPPGLPGFPGARGGRRG
jgi:hypothetical protein